jgi:acyl carrier protein
MTPTEMTLSRFVSDEILRGASPDEIDVEHPLLETGILDSLGLQQLVTFLEREFEIELEDDHLVLENFASIGAIARLIESIRR